MAQTVAELRKNILLVIVFIFTCLGGIAKTVYVDSDEEKKIQAQMLKELEMVNQQLAVYNQEKKENDKRIRAIEDWKLEHVAVTE